MKELEKTLKVFANKRRLEIVALLMEHRKLPLNDIRRALRLSYRSTSKHIRRMYECNIVEREFVHGEIHYFLNQGVSKQCKRILDLIEEERARE